MSQWKLVPLRELLTESKVESKKPNSKKRIRVKLNLAGIEKRPDTNDIKGATRYYIRKAGQFIYGQQNLHKGALGIVPQELDGFESSADIPAFDISESCYPEWVFFFFKQNDFYLRLENLAKGVGSKRISPKQVLELKIPLPSKSDQKGILDNLNALETDIEKGRTEIAKQLELLDKLKENTYSDAFNGTITREWRKLSSHSLDAKSELVQIITSKKKLIADKIYSKEKILEPLDDSEIPFKLPQSWVWCRLDDIMHIASGVTKGKIYRDELISVPYLRVANVQRDFLDLTLIKNITVSKSDYAKYQLKEDDLLMAEGGDADKVGRCAVWRNEIPGCIHQNHIFRIRAFSKILLNTEYIKAFINSPLNSKYYENKSKQTTNLASINKTIVRCTPIALPPLLEQEEISKKLNNLKDDISSSEIQIRQNGSELEQLADSILSEIFGDANKQLKAVEKNSDIDYSPISQNVNYGTGMEIEDLLKKNGKMSALDLWKSSKFENDIDAFYEELKVLIEVKKTVKENKKEGFLELAK